MREILFHGKRADSGEWVEGDVLQTRYHSGHIEYQIMPQTPVSSAYPVIPETVGQYTGLTDKNGKRIFEGDIIQFGARIKDVRWNSETMAWELTDIGVPDCDVNHLHNTVSLSELYVETCYGEMTSEVIGNIHDNPELLGKEDT